MNEVKVTGRQKIGDLEFISIEGGFGEGKKAMTVKDIAKIHKKEVKVINQAVNMNRRRFSDGIDIVDLKSVVNQIDLEKFGFSQNAINRSKNIYLLSERGYSKLLKILEDDTAWEIYDQLVDGYFSMRNHIKSEKQNVSIESETKRMNAEARLKNANSRQAKLLAELAKDATTEVNKVLLQDRAVEILSGKKLLKKPTFKQKMLDCKTIAERLGILTKNGEPHITAVSQLIQCHIAVNEKESEIVPFFNGHKSGSMINYAESVLTKVQIWLEDHNYPSKIQGVNKKYHVQYE